MSENTAGAEEPIPPTGAYLGLVVLENQRLQRGASLSPSPSANSVGIERNINYPTPLRGRRFAGKKIALLMSLLSLVRVTLARFYPEDAGKHGLVETSIHEVIY